MYKNPEARKAWLEANVEKVRAYKRAWYDRQDHTYVYKPQTAARKKYMTEYNKQYHTDKYIGEFRDEKRVYNRERRYTQPEKVKNAELMVHYGITLDEYTALLTKQDGKCAICLNPETAVLRGKVRSLAVDHCHETGKVRGLLCGRCNSALGLLGEDVDRLKAMIVYIEAYS